MNKCAESFVKNVKTLMEKAQLSAAETARRAQMTPQQFNSYLNEGRSPSFEVLDRIAAVFNVSSADLFKPRLAPVPHVAHSIKDCLEAINTALTGKPVTIQMNQVQVEASSDPKLDRIIELATALNDEHRTHALLILEALTRTADAAAAAALVAKKEAK